MNVGGPAWQTSVLTRQIDPDRFETRLLVGSTDGDEADFLALRDPDLPVGIVPGLGRSPGLLDDLRAFWSLCREIRRFRPDIVHTHTAKAGVEAVHRKDARRRSQMCHHRIHVEPTDT